MFNSVIRPLLFSCICLLPCTGNAADSADPFKACARCHGSDGNSAKASAPSIAGLTSEYMTTALNGYRDGSRICGQVKIKCKMAAKLTDQKIADAAAHYAQSSRVRAAQEFDATLAAKGKIIHEASCAECHSATASGTEQGGMLEGQWRKYLEYALGQYANGGRSQPDGMKSATADLNDDDRNALLHYYASDL